MARNLKELYEILIEKYRNVRIPKESNGISRNCLIGDRATTRV